MENRKTADDSKADKNDYLYHLHRWVYFSGLLAEQCEGWLSAEEGNENLLRRYREHKKYVLLPPQ